MDFLNSTQKTIADLRKTSLGGNLVMRPPFQRKLVWNSAQQSYLIDTILKGFPIPELYIQVKTDEDGNEVLYVVDGQQRISTVLAFATENGFALEMQADENYKGDLKYDGKQFKDLSPDDKKKIFGYRFVVRILPELPEETLRDMFLRLNRNVVSLNDQELRHAQFPGDFLATIEEIAEWDFWLNSRIATPKDVRRMLDAEFVSELVVQMLHGEQNKKDSLNDYYTLYSRKFDKKEQAQIRATFKHVLTEIDHVLPDIEKTRWRKRSDFYTLFGYFVLSLGSFPFSAPLRASLKRGLPIFASEVDQTITKLKQIKKEAQTGEGPVRDYVWGVEKAASDLSRRRLRRLALGKFLEGPQQIKLMP